MEGTARHLLKEIEDKFKLLDAEQDSRIKQRHFDDLASLRAVVKRLDEKSRNFFWRRLHSDIRNNYSRQYEEMKAIWKRYEVASEKMKQQLSSSQYLQPGGLDASASYSTLLWQDPSTLSFAPEPQASALSQAQGTMGQNSSALQPSCSTPGNQQMVTGQPGAQQPVLDRPIWLQADYQRFLDDPSTGPMVALGLSMAPGPVTRQQGPHSLGPAPRSPSGQQSSDQAGHSPQNPDQHQGANHRRLASDVTFTAVGGPLSSLWDVTRTSSESGASSQYYDTLEYQVDPTTGQPIFPRTSESCKGSRPHGH